MLIHVQACRFFGSIGFVSVHRVESKFSPRNKWPVSQKLVKKEITKLSKTIFKVNSKSANNQTFQEKQC